MPVSVKSVYFRAEELLLFKQDVIYVRIAYFSASVQTFIYTIETVLRADKLDNEIGFFFF